MDKSIIPYTEEDMRLSLLKFMIAKRQPNLKNNAYQDHDI